MAMKNLVVLDANILIRFITQGKSGCELSAWEELQQLAANSAISFLLPEVIELEVERFSHHLDQMYEKEFIGLRERLAKFQKEKTWSEVQDIHAFLTEKFEEWTKAKKEASQQRRALVENWLKSHLVKKVPLDSEILFQAKRRMMAGRYPAAEEEANQGRRPENDCCIVESIIAFFRGNKPDSQLLICTENLKDFGFQFKGKNACNLHPLLKDGMPLKTRIFTEVSALLDFVKGREQVKEPKPLELKVALEEAAIRQVNESVNARKDSAWLAKEFERYRFGPVQLPIEGATWFSPIAVTGVIPVDYRAFSTGGHGIGEPVTAATGYGKIPTNYTLTWSSGQIDSSPAGSEKPVPSEKEDPKIEEGQ
jgi:hypothetical protein